MSTQREFYAHFRFLSLAMVRLEDCESLFTHLKDERADAETFSVRHFSGIRQPLDAQDLDNSNWVPGLGNPAGGLTKTENDMAPPLCLLKSGAEKSWLPPSFAGRNVRGSFFSYSRTIRVIFFFCDHLGAYACLVNSLLLLWVGRGGARLSTQQYTNNGHT